VLGRSFTGLHGTPIKRINVLPERSNSNLELGLIS